MTPEKFSQKLHEVVSVENSKIYRDLFFNTSAEKASDPYWKKALTLFGTLTLEQKEVFFSVIRQISIDATSNVLGIIDGVSTFDEPLSVFELTCDGTHLEGDLQGLFLSEAEKSITS